MQEEDPQPIDEPLPGDPPGSGGGGDKGDPPGSGGGGIIAPAEEGDPPGSGGGGEEGDPPGSGGGGENNP